MSEKNTISKLHTEIQCVKEVSVFQLQTTNKRLRSLLFRNVKQCRLVVSYWLWDNLLVPSSMVKQTKKNVHNIP